MPHSSGPAAAAHCRIPLMLQVPPLGLRQASVLNLYAQIPPLKHDWRHCCSCDADFLLICGLQTSALERTSSAFGSGLHSQGSQGEADALSQQLMAATPGLDVYAACIPPSLSNMTHAGPNFLER